jgi:hypothetical protein
MGTPSREKPGTPIRPRRCNCAELWPFWGAPAGEDPSLHHRHSKRRCTPDSWAHTGLKKSAQMQQPSGMHPHPQRVLDRQWRWSGKPAVPCPAHRRAQTLAPSPAHLGLRRGPRPRSGYRPRRALTSRVSASSLWSRSSVTGSLGFNNAVPLLSPLTPPG